MIREMLESDIKEVVELDQEFFLSPYDEKQIRYELLENPFSFLYVAIEEEKIVGFIDFWITFDIGQLNQIAVLPSFRRKGIASVLLEKAFQMMYEKRVVNVTLEVRYHNEKAIQFYQKHGFIKTLTKKAYYDNGDDAYYMERGMLDV